MAIPPSLQKKKIRIPVGYKSYSPLLMTQFDNRAGLQLLNITNPFDWVSQPFSFRFFLRILVTIKTPMFILNVQQTMPVPILIVFKVYISGYVSLDKRSHN